MRYKELLLEYNKPKLIQQYEQLFDQKAFSALEVGGQNLEQSLSQLDSYLQQNNIQKTIDPYIKWIIHRYVTDGIRYWEDVLSKVVPALVTYDKLKKKNKLEPNERDVNQIKSEEQLLDLIDKYKEEELSSGSDKEKEIEQNFFKTDQAELLYDTDEYKIIKPLTEEASCYFGRNTRWCTSATQSANYFLYYTRSGTLYIILHKPTNRRWQFFFSKFKKPQYTDEKDKPIKLRDFKEKHPEVIKFLATLPNSPILIRFMTVDNPSEDLQIEMVKEYPKLFVGPDAIPITSDKVLNAAMKVSKAFLINKLEKEGKPTGFEGNIKTGLKKLNKYQPAKIKAIYKALPLIENYVNDPGFEKEVTITWKKISWELKKIRTLDNISLGADIQITGALNDGTPVYYFYRQGESDMSGQRLFKIGKNAKEKISRIDHPFRSPEPSEQLQKIFNDILKK